MRCSVPHREQWLWAPGYEGRYEVSSLGRVRTYIGVGKWRPSVRPRGFLYVHNADGSSGYPWVYMSRGGRSSGKPPRGSCIRAPLKLHVSINVLVATAFHGPKPFPSAVARHLDGVRSNNLAENIRWGTHKDNEEDKVRQGRPHGGGGGLAWLRGVVRKCRGCGLFRGRKHACTLHHPGHRARVLVQ